MSDTSSGRTGPVESQPWPTQVDAHVVTPGARPRMHGYDVENDLAKGGSLTEIMLLAITGELPSKAARDAVDAALQFAAAVSIADASVHATALGRLSGASVGGLVSIASIGLAEQARADLEALGDWPSQLARDPEATPPEIARSDDPEYCASLALQARVARPGFDVPALRHRLDRFAAIVAVLVAAGVREPASIVALLVAARLPTAIAEASHVKVADFRSYPMNTPAFAYEAP